MSPLRNCVIYGGTFDPIHYGHVRTAMAVQDFFHFDCCFFLPCKIPLLKNPACASPLQRAAMIERALAEVPKSYSFKLDCMELNRDTPSYMIYTLSEYRRLLPADTSITLLLGEDAFSGLPHWQGWKQLIHLANLLVLSRKSLAGLAHDPLLQFMIRNHETDSPLSLLTTPHGSLTWFDAGDYPVSATQLRQQLASNPEVSSWLAPAVWDYIKQHKLYGFSGT